MTTLPGWSLAVAAVLFAVGCFGWYKWLKIKNSPRGEELTKFVTQGPFVPIGDHTNQSPRH